MNAAVEVAMQEWTAGERRLAEIETTAARRAVLYGVVAEIAAALSERYQTDVTADVTEYLSRLAERELIQ